MAVDDGNAETIIPGEQITALKMPFEFSYNWFPSSGVLALAMLDPAADFDVRVNGNTYAAGSVNLFDFQQCTSSIPSNDLAVAPSHSIYTAGDGIS